MLNRLLADIGNGLAKKPFERISWWWGPRWVDFISVDQPLTVDNPLWQRDKSSLKNIRLFGLSPDELQAEIIAYWQQPFWKRWLLGLFTSIHSKIKLWSYYHRCLSLHKVCKKDRYGTNEPIELVFEQYLGIEMLHRLNKNRIQFENYFEKRAGNLTIKNNLSHLHSLFIRKHWKLFSKLMKKKLSQLSTEDKDSLQSQLKRESDRLEMILFCYLSNWLKKIFEPPRTDDETINDGTLVDVFAGKEISYSIHSIKDWVRMKQQVIQSLLEGQSPEQFLNIKNLLESCLSKLKTLVDMHLNNGVKLIVAVRKRKLSCKDAIRQTRILQTELIHLLKKSIVLFHPDKSFGNEELGKIQTELLQQFQELAEESQEIIEKKLQLLWDYLPKRTTRQKVQKMEQEVNGNMPELEQGTETNFTQTRIEREETKANVDICIHSQVRSKLIHNPPNDFILEENNIQQKDEQRFRRLQRYTPVF